MSLDDEAAVGEYLKTADLQLKKLSTALQKCDDQTKKEYVEKAISDLTKTVSKLKEGSIHMFELHPFDFSLVISKENLETPIEITVKVNQISESIPLPLGSYIEITSPFNSSVCSDLVHTRTNANFFEFKVKGGKTNEEDIHVLKKQGLTMKLILVQKSIMKKEESMIGLSSITLTSLQHQKTFTLPLTLISLDGKLTRFKFQINLEVNQLLQPTKPYKLKQKLMIYQPKQYNFMEPVK